MNQSAFHHADAMTHQAGTNPNGRTALRRAQRKRRRDLVRFINAHAARLEGKHQGFTDIGPRWGYGDAARSVETSFGLRPGSTLHYFALIERHAEFCELFDWSPTRRDTVLWEQDYRGPELP